MIERETNHERKSSMTSCLTYHSETEISKDLLPATFLSEKVYVESTGGQDIRSKATIYPENMHIHWYFFAKKG